MVAAESKVSLPIVQVDRSLTTPLALVLGEDTFAGC